MVCAAVDAAEDMTLVARVGRHDTVDQAVAAGAQVCHVRSIVLLEQHHIAIYAVSRLDNDRVHILDLDQRVCGCLLAWRQSALDCAVQHLITLSNQVVLTSSPSSHIAAHHPMRPCHMRHDCAPPHAAIPHAPHEHVLKNSDRIPLCAAPGSDRLHTPRREPSVGGCCRWRRLARCRRHQWVRRDSNTGCWQAGGWLSRRRCCGALRCAALRLLLC
jgi:hypothetical protein